MKRFVFAALLAALATPVLADPVGNLLQQNAANINGTPVGGAKPSASVGGGTNVFTDIANWVGGDLAAAQALATATKVKDWNGLACWNAAQNFSDVMKAHPVPVTLKAASDVEALRLAVSSAKSLCMEPSCIQLSADVLQGIAQMGIGIPPPVTLETLCAKIPSITLGTQPTPAPTPTPTPTGN